MTDPTLAQALHSVISAAGLIGIAWLYRGYRVDQLRDDLFGLRDEVFDYAAANGLLAHPGYRQLRASFNAMLRFCHRITVMRLLLAIWLDWSHAPATVNDWASSFSDLPDQHRDALLAYHDRMISRVARFVLVGSPIGWCLMAHRKVRAILGRGEHPPSANWRRGWQLIERHALET